MDKRLVITQTAGIISFLYKKMKINLYFILFYILFKFSKIVASKTSQAKEFANSALLSLTICQFLLILAFFIYFDIWHSSLNYRNYSFLFLGFILLILYSINHWIFIRNEKYIEIEEYYDKINLNKNTIIVIALFFLILSFASFYIIIFKH